MTNQPSNKAKRQAAQQSAYEREQRQRTLRIAAIVIVAIFVVGGLIYWVANETVKGQNEWAIRPTADPQEQVIAAEPRNHVAEGSTLTYQHYPPSTGMHYATPAGPGFYDQEFSEGYWVHSLEHGYVVILYNCTATTNCDTLKSQVKDFISNAPTHGCDKTRLIGVPYSRGMSTPLSLLAMAGPFDAATQLADGIQLDLPEFDQTRMMNFYKRYDNHGPEDVGCP
jgi:hypothetical protein